ncbi:MAG: PBP1A family penicillin-binding protein [Acidobacteria bacterium]|nr:PBP1A family penicillin-binding protein [Acidobacteriota bacterium]MBI3424420.1 PBP1A family penicillin-binding protein [Acidobacteriota bacterium]
MERPRRRFFSPLLLAPLLVIGLIGVGAAVYYYQQYTAIIDAGLRGDIFVRSSGIYAAPPVLRQGIPMKPADLVTHLKRVGYLEAGTTQNQNRGQYTVRGNVIELRPSADAAIDGDYTFRPLRINFNGSGIQSVNDLSTREQLTEAPIEPEVVSSIVNESREKRKIIEYKDMPQTLVDAITSVEDRSFFEHYGINWSGVIRAFIKNQQAGEVREGGSSISQQLVKKLFLTDERVWSRKLPEAYMTILLEQRLSKQQILAMYCNLIYLGQRGSFSINGFGMAARAYFDKDISQLTLPESAMLAGIIRSPNRYSPFQHEERAKDRRDKVLSIMVETGKITSEQAEKAKLQPLGLKGKGAGSLDANDAPYFIDYLTKQLEAQFDNREALKNLRIYSTLDIDLQRAAYAAVSRQMAAIDKLFAKRKGGTAGLQTALVAMNPKTGEVLAMVGGRDYGQSQLNRVTEARRQPGSVFKPFVYAAALTEGADEGGQAITPATMFLDAARTFNYGNGQTYSPGNFKDQFSNKKITMRDALVNSKNVITVELAQLIGFSTVARLAERAGIQRVPTYPSMALGVAEATPLQVASAYTMFANQGKRVLPIAYTRITSGSGATLKTTQTESRDILQPQVAYLMTSMLKDVLDRGTGTRVRAMGFKGIAAGKTGSSRDGWFAGYTPNLVCVVWVGFDDNSDLGLTGGATAAPIWADFMIKALQLRPDLGGDFQDPGDLVTVDIDPATGMVAQTDTPNVRHELFLRGTEPGPGTPYSPDGDNPEPVPTPKPVKLEEPPYVEPKPPAAKEKSGERLARNPNGELPNYSSPMVSIQVCALTGLLPVRGVCTRTAWRKFAYGKEPTDDCSESRHERQRLIGTNGGQER